MSYKMPAVEVGLDVWWHPDGPASEPHPAKVLAVGFDNVLVAVYEKNLKNFEIRDGVRHVGDARAKSFELTEAGVWDYTPLQKLLGIPDALDKLRRDREAPERRPEKK